MLNQTLKNRYKVIAQLGQGAMGLVYRAVDRQTRQEAAVKVIASNMALAPDMLARFRREGEALRQLRHRNIVAFGEMFEHQGQQVIVMEYLAGGNLHALIKRGPLATVAVVRLTLELCDALVQAHHLGIIHRDLKPENVLLTPDGVPKLTDFGIARLVNETAGLTQTGAVMGTPYYMSPEAWQGQPLDAQADVWSLGVMMYEMVSGKLPFAGDTLPAVMNKVLTEAPPDLRSLTPQTPEALVRIIERMLKRDKSERYRTMRQVAVDLEEIQWELGGLAVEENRPAVEANRKSPDDVRPTAAGHSSTGSLARRPTIAAPTSVAPWARRPLALWGGGGLVLVCLMAALGWGAWRVVGGILAPATSATQIVRTSTVAPSPSQAPSQTHLSPPPTLTPAPLATAVPSQAVPAAPVLGIGATQIYADGMAGLYVPAGTFLMGTSSTDESAPDDEKPQHSVYLDAYWIDQTEVTNAMFARFVQAAHYQTDAEKAGTGMAFDPASATWADTRGANWQHPHGPSSAIDGLDDHPVVQVSWNDAKAYCEWTGRRLPTEAEWEKAARGTDGRDYPWGAGPVAAELVNFADKNMKVRWADKALDDGFQYTAPAGSYPGGASPYRALDMAGNVWEWVADWLRADYYSDTPDRNPAGPVSGLFRVLRGGGWYSAATDVRAAYRAWEDPGYRVSDGGFRCACAAGTGQEITPTRPR